MINAKVIEATRSAAGKSIYTLQLKYHRFIHGELLTHRVFSRNSMSSRAIPVRKMLAQVWNDPAMPVHWGQNRPGMQAKSQLAGWRLRAARWMWGAVTPKVVCCLVWVLDKLGLHKQVSNRLLEPWQWMHTVLTSTEWDNFYELRCHPDAQPEFQRLAYAVQSAIENCTVRQCPEFAEDGMDAIHWHLPYISDEERVSFPLADLLQFSAARCARVSYLTHDGAVPDPAKDKKLYDMLVGSRPLHASPIEHQARQASYAFVQSNNFRGWEQHRWIMEQADIVDSMFNKRSFYATRLAVIPCSTP